MARPTRRQASGRLADPFGRHDQRRWDGDRWSERVRDGEMHGIDPPGIDTAPSRAELERPAAPIDDAPEPVQMRPLSLPRVLAVTVVLVVVILVLVVVGIATA